MMMSNNSNASRLSMPSSLPQQQSHLRYYHPQTTNRMMATGRGSGSVSAGDPNTTNNNNTNNSNNTNNNSNNTTNKNNMTLSNLNNTISMVQSSNLKQMPSNLSQKNNMLIGLLENNTINNNSEKNKLNGCFFSYFNFGLNNSKFRKRCS